MPAYGYEFYLLVFNSISHLFAALTRVLSLFTDFMTPGSENTLTVILPLVKCKTIVLYLCYTSI